MAIIGFIVAYISTKCRCYHATLFAKSPYCTLAVVNLLSPKLILNTSDSDATYYYSLRANSTIQPSFELMNIKLNHFTNQ